MASSSSSASLYSVTGSDMSHSGSLSSAPDHFSAAQQSSLAAFITKKKVIDDHVDTLTNLPDLRPFDDDAFGEPEPSSSQEAVDRHRKCRNMLEECWKQYDSIEREADEIDRGDVRELRALAKAASQKTLSSADADLIELTLTTLSSLDKLLSLLRHRSRALNVLHLRTEWEYYFASVAIEQKIIMHDVSRFITKARWSLPPDQLSTLSASSSPRKLSLSSNTISSMSRSIRAQTLSLDLARLTSRLQTLVHTTLQNCARSIDILIDKSFTRIPDAWLDKQDRLELNLRAETEGLGVFLSKLFRQWSHADQCHATIIELVQTLSKLIHEIDQALLKTPSTERRHSLESRLQDLRKRCISCKDTVSSVPHPTHANFSDQIAATDLTVNSLENAFKVVQNLFDSAEIAFQTYQNASDAYENSAKLKLLVRERIDVLHSRIKTVTTLQMDVLDESCFRVNFLDCSPVIESKGASATIEKLISESESLIESPIKSVITHLHNAQIDPNVLQNLREVYHRYSTLLTEAQVSNTTFKNLLRRIILAREFYCKLDSIQDDILKFSADLNEAILNSKWTSLQHKIDSQALQSRYQLLRGNFRTDIDDEQIEHLEIGSVLSVLLKKRKDSIHLDLRELYERLELLHRLQEQTTSLHQVSQEAYDVSSKVDSLIMSLQSFTSLSMDARFDAQQKLLTSLVSSFIHSVNERVPLVTLSGHSSLDTPYSPSHSLDLISITPSDQAILDRATQSIIHNITSTLVKDLNRLEASCRRRSWAQRLDFINKCIESVAKEVDVLSDDLKSIQAASTTPQSHDEITSRLASLHFSCINQISDNDSLQLELDQFNMEISHQSANLDVISSFKTLGTSKSRVTEIVDQVEKAMESEAKRELEAKRKEQEERQKEAERLKRIGNWNEKLESAFSELQNILDAIMALETPFSLFEGPLDVSNPYPFEHFHQLSNAALSNSNSDYDDIVYQSDDLNLSTTSHLCNALDMQCASVLGNITRLQQSLIFLNKDIAESNLHDNNSILEKTIDFSTTAEHYQSRAVVIQKKAKDLSSFLPLLALAKREIEEKKLREQYEEEQRKSTLSQVQQLQEEIKESESRVWEIISISNIDDLQTEESDMAQNNLDNLRNQLQSLSSRTEHFEEMDIILGTCTASIEKQNESLQSYNQKLEELRHKIREEEEEEEENVRRSSVAISEARAVSIHDEGYDGEGETEATGNTSKSTNPEDDISLECSKSFATDGVNEASVIVHSDIEVEGGEFVSTDYDAKNDNSESEDEGEITSFDFGKSSGTITDLEDIQKDRILSFIEEINDLVVSIADQKSKFNEAIKIDDLPSMRDICDRYAPLQKTVETLVSNISSTIGDISSENERDMLEQSRKSLNLQQATLERFQYRIKFAEEVRKLENLFSDLLISMEDADVFSPISPLYTRSKSKGSADPYRKQGSLHGSASRSQISLEYSVEDCLSDIRRQLETVQELSKSLEDEVGIIEKLDILEKTSEEMVTMALDHLTLFPPQRSAKDLCLDSNHRPPSEAQSMPDEFGSINRLSSSGSSHGLPTGRRGTIGSLSINKSRIPLQTRRSTSGNFPKSPSGTLSINSGDTPRPPNARRSTSGNQVSQLSKSRTKSSTCLRPSLSSPICLPTPTTPRPRWSSSKDYSAQTISSFWKGKEKERVRYKSSSRPVDQAIGRIVDTLNFPVSIVPAEKGQAEDMSGKYWIGSPEPRLYYCRILRSSMCMVRVGGGWQELGRFLRDHHAPMIPPSSSTDLGSEIGSAHPYIKKRLSVDKLNTFEITPMRRRRFLTPKSSFNNGPGESNLLSPSLTTPLLSPSTPSYFERRLEDGSLSTSNSTDQSAPPSPYLKRSQRASDVSTLNGVDEKGRIIPAIEQPYQTIADNNASKSSEHLNVYLTAHVEGRSPPCSQRRRRSTLFWKV